MNARLNLTSAKGIKDSPANTKHEDSPNNPDFPMMAIGANTSSQLSFLRIIKFVELKSSQRRL
jgi:hypothetical protein